MQTTTQAAAREDMFRKMDTETIEIRTDRSYVEPLVRFFRKRERRL
jgi:vacuolar-type H+-ATPase subunit C/Vma6